MTNWMDYWLDNIEQFIQAISFRPFPEYIKQTVQNTNCLEEAGMCKKYLIHTCITM